MSASKDGLARAGSSSLIRLMVLKFVLGMYASKDVLALASLKWRGKAVFIRRRTEDDIKLANSVDQGIM
ncbi:hypothetical protein MKW92_020701 [Papaver armeniacum]|nr:hypothetical protein MKW92_020701 [Papaver armeniacum]